MVMCDWFLRHCLMLHYDFGLQLVVDVCNCVIAKARHLIDKLLDSTIEANGKRNAPEEMHNNTKKQRSAIKHGMYRQVDSGTGYMHILQRGDCPGFDRFQIAAAFSR